MSRLAVLHRTPERRDRSPLSRSDWGTPRYLIDALEAELGEPFALDMAARADNSIVPKAWLGPGSLFAEDALAPDALDRIPSGLWGRPWFLNWVYGRSTARWLGLCDRAARKGARIVALGPARTDTKWFQGLDPETAQLVRLIKGRIKFVGAPAPAPFPSVTIHFERPAIVPAAELRIVRWAIPKGLRAIAPGAEG